MKQRFSVSPTLAPAVASILLALTIKRRLRPEFLHNLAANIARWVTHLFTLKQNRMHVKIKSLSFFESPLVKIAMLSAAVFQAVWMWRRWWSCCCLCSLVSCSRTNTTSTTWAWPRHSPSWRGRLLVRITEKGDTPAMKTMLVGISPKEGEEVKLSYLNIFYSICLASPSTQFYIYIYLYCIYLCDIDTLHITYVCTVSISGLEPDSPQPQPWQSKIVTGNKDNELYSQRLFYSTRAEAGGCLVQDQISILYLHILSR